MLDDINTPGFIANLNKMIKDFSSSSDEDQIIYKSKLDAATKLLGICNLSYSDWDSFHDKGLDKEKINQLINDRLIAKKEKAFEKADAIRDELLKMGIEIKDTETGTDWNQKS